MEIEMEKDIERQLVDFVQTVTTDTSITAETDLLMSDVLDSLLLMDLVIVIENEFGITLSGEEIAPHNFRTLATLAHIVQTNMFDATFKSRFAA